MMRTKSSKTTMPWQRVPLAVVCIIALSCFDTPAQAQGETAPFGELSGSATFMTDYIFYGLGYSDNGPAAMATLGWTGPEIAGIATPSASIYGINVDASQGGLELGYSFGLEKGVGLTSLYLGTTYYQYPAQDNDKEGTPAVAAKPEVVDNPSTAGVDESRDAIEAEDAAPNVGDGDFLELQVSLTQGLPLADMEANIYYAYSGDGYGNSGPYHLTAFSLGLPLEPIWDGLSASALIGFFDGHEESGGSDDYVYWDIGLALEIDRLSFGLNYIETDLATSPLTDSRVLFSLSYGF